MQTGISLAFENCEISKEAYIKLRHVFIVKVLFLKRFAEQRCYEDCQWSKIIKKCIGQLKFIVIISWRVSGVCFHFT